MTIAEYFGEWMKVIDVKELNKILNKIKDIHYICPNKANIFKAFELCPYNKCRIIMLFQDPYPQKSIATGIALGNNKNTLEEKLSPSLKIIKDCVVDLSVPHNIINFDVTLESWCRQGILMLNSALTCEVNNIGSHVNLWRPFIASLLKNISNNNLGIIYVLFGKQAQTFTPYINSQGNYILQCEHPAYFARMNKDMPRTIFNKIDELIKTIYNDKIIWYEENNN